MTATGTGTSRKGWKKDLEKIIAERFIRSFGFIAVANSSRMSSSLHLQRLFMRNARSAGRWTSQLGASSALQHTRGFVSATLPLLEKKSVKVPSMGDSITEVSAGLSCLACSNRSDTLLNFRFAGNNRGMGCPSRRGGQGR
jgi:hypothetical protein